MRNCSISFSALIQSCLGPFGLWSENPLPNINHAYSKLKQEEQLKNMAKGEEKNSTYDGTVFALSSCTNPPYFVANATKEVMRTKIVSRP